jgi:hypothetical protein
MSSTAKRFRPQLEALEDRQLLATKVTFDFTNTIMYLRGDNKPNNVQIIDDGTGGFGNITGFADNQSFDELTAGRRIRNIVIDLGKGNDSVIYRVLPTAPGNVVTGNMALTARLGIGNDIFAFAIDGVTMIGAIYDFQVFGGAGNDIITGSAVNTTLLGSAQLGFNVQGDAGTDTIRAVHSGFLDFRTVLTLQLSGGRHNDDISIDSLISPFSLGRANYRVNGDEGSDKLDLVARQEGPELRAGLIGIIDGGSGPNDVRRPLKFRDIETITLTGNIQLDNVDPRSHITYIRF